ncbi:hypothetical protein HOA92_01055 [archaeon]|jgi:hypothetical protein|nr:hypothetical protein [archaeon]MBT6761606.1 hypothetical protein [archaeon]
MVDENKNWNSWCLADFSGHYETFFKRCVKYSDWTADQFATELDTTYNGLNFAGVITSGSKGLEFFEALVENGVVKDVSATHADYNQNLASIAGLAIKIGMGEGTLFSLPEFLDVYKAKLAEDSPSSVHGSTSFYDALEDNGLLDMAFPKPVNSFEAWTVDQFVTELDTTYNGLTFSEIITSTPNGLGLFEAIVENKVLRKISTSRADYTHTDYNRDLASIAGLANELEMTGTFSLSEFLDVYKAKLAKDKPSWNDDFKKHYSQNFEGRSYPN